MRPTRWLLGAAALVLIAGLLAAFFLVDYQDKATRTSVGVALGAGAVATTAAFVLTFLLQSTLSKNSFRLTLSLTRDLSLSDFERAKLRETSFRGRQFVGANFTRAHLRGGDFAGCDLRGANFAGADLREVDLRGADLRAARFRKANLQGARLWDARISGADFRDSCLRRTELINVHGAPLNDDEIDEIYAKGATVHTVYSRERAKEGGHDRWRISWLERADLAGADLTGADLKFADLTEAELAYADLSNGQSDCRRPSPSPRIRGKLSDLFMHERHGHNWLTNRPADLTGCQLWKTSFRGANLDGTLLSWPLGQLDTEYSVGTPSTPSDDGAPDEFRPEGEDPDSPAASRGVGRNPE